MRRKFIVAAREIHERTARVISLKSEGKYYNKTELIIHDDTEEQLPKHESKDEENYFINTIHRNEHTRGDVLKEIFSLSFLCRRMLFQNSLFFHRDFFIIAPKNEEIFYGTLQFANIAKFSCILEIHKILKINIACSPSRQDKT